MGEAKQDPVTKIVETVKKMPTNKPEHKGTVVSKDGQRVTLTEE